MAKKVDIQDYLPDELKSDEFVEDEQEEEEDDIIVIETEDGEEKECQVLTVFEIEDFKQDYIALLPLDQLEGVDPDEDEEFDAEVLFYRYDENGDDVELSTLESDEEFNAVREVFETILAEEAEE